MNLTEDIAPPPVPEAIATTPPTSSGIAYPLQMSFKVLAFSNQIFVKDATGQPVLYVKHKLFKFKEHIEIFTDSSKSTKLADIHANKLIDWSARYYASDAEGQALGSVGRRGWRSLWSAHYESFKPNSDQADFSLREENPAIKVLDSLLGEIPIIGLATAFFFHPKYLASSPDGRPVMRMTKQPAFWEGKFTLEKLGDLPPREELNLILSFLMMALLERRRG